jgi:hypothetical protein
MDFNKGDRIRVTGTVEDTDVAIFGSITFRPDGGSPCVIYRPFNEGAVEHLAPENWPPQVGDIWKIGMFEYVIMYDADSHTIGAFPVEGGFTRYHLQDEEFKGRNPVLVRRRG